jgi:hypothetical protein
MDIVIKNWNSFLCYEFTTDEKGNDVYDKNGNLIYKDSEEYKKLKNRKINGKKDLKKSCMLKFLEIDAITQSDYDRFLLLQEVRHKYVHEMDKIIYDGISKSDYENLEFLFYLWEKVDKWWINEIEMEIRDEPKEWDKDKVTSLVFLLFKQVLLPYLNIPFIDAMKPDLPIEVDWPKESDVLFQKYKYGDGLYDWTRQGANFTLRAMAMTDGYKDAADVLIDATENMGNRKDILIFPVIFNYRHYLELKMKCIIADYGQAFSDVEPNWNSHNLLDLWSRVKKIIDSLQNGDDDNAATVIIEKHIKEMNEVDQNSFSYRYHVDTKGNPIEYGSAHWWLDVKNLKRVMNTIYNYFDAVDSHLGQILSENS